jgi:polyphenol oxidase
MQDERSVQFLICSQFTNPAVRTLLTTRFVNERGINLRDKTPAANDQFNLATHVGDDPSLVDRNRALLRRYLPNDPLWLNQVHGIGVADDSMLVVPLPTADAAITLIPRRVVAVLTADCLPVVFASVPDTQLAHGQSPQGIAVAHAGWRGLVNGVLEATVAALRAQLPPRTTIEAGFGAAIGPTAFEVGDEVFRAFCEQAKTPVQLQKIKAAFKPKQGLEHQKWLANLYQLAQIRLAQIGVTVLAQPNWCTFNDEQHFFSHRRDTLQLRKLLPRDGVFKDGPNLVQAGRQASLVWLER